jgi:hypothetical protein
MKLGELTASRRRIGPLRALDESGNPILGEDFSGPGELEISLAGAAMIAPSGTITEIGSGYYYYEATETEAQSAPWIAVKITGVCVEFTFEEDVSIKLNGIIVNETDATLRYIGPLRFLDADTGDPLGALDVAAATKEITINGAAWSAPDGTFVFLDDGYLYYAADATEVTEVGWIAVKLSGTCVEFTFRQDIISPSGGVGASGAVVSITNGTLGRWSEVTARIRITDGVPYVRYVSNSLKFWLYDPVDGFVSNFNQRSSVVLDDTEDEDMYVFTILPNGGWWTDQFRLKFVAGIELEQE